MGNEMERVEIGEVTKDWKGPSEHTPSEIQADTSMLCFRNDDERKSYKEKYTDRVAVFHNAKSAQEYMELQDDLT